MRYFLSILLIANVGAADLKLPLKQKSVRFAVIGDMGTGLKPQYETARQMKTWHEKFPFEFVLMLGDNLYGHQRPEDFKKKFEEPYQPLLNAGVKFYATLGNHDDPNERFYKRHMSIERGGGSPDTEAMRAARHNIRYHLAYIGWLVRTRDWLAGDSLTYADLSAAAHLSVADYLGDVPWDEDETAKNWYARIKSRPSFRALLAEALPGLPPSQTYADLDF